MLDRIIECVICITIIICKILTILHIRLCPNPHIAYTYGRTGMKVKFIYVHVLVGRINYGRYIQIRYSSAICI